MTLSSTLSLTAAQRSTLASRRVFFGHQSVGANIVAGIGDLLAADSTLRLHVVRSDAPDSVPGPAFVEAAVGENGQPLSKTEAFSAALARGLGPHGGIALHKYCYVDFDASTDVPALFAQYRAAIERLRHAHPEITIVHVTTPLTVAPSFRSALIARLRGRATATAANARRNEFNALLRRTYADRDPIFDLATIESTHLDGSRAFQLVGRDTVYALAPEYTTDGGHLNALGRRLAAARLLELLATL